MMMNDMLFHENADDDIDDTNVDDSDCPVTVMRCQKCYVFFDDVNKEVSMMVVGVIVVVMV